MMKHKMQQRPHGCGATMNGKKKQVQVVYEYDMFNSTLILCR